MTIQKIYPDALAKPHGYAHVLVGTGSKLVCTSGQLAIDADENLVGGERDYRAQGYQAAGNVYAALEAAGASAADVVRLMIYVVDPTADNLEQLYVGLGEAGAEAGAKATATTLVGIAALSLPGAVVEIDATALID